MALLARLARLVLTEQQVRLAHPELDRPAPRARLAQQAQQALMGLLGRLGPLARLGRMEQQGRRELLVQQVRMVPPAQQGRLERLAQLVPLVLRGKAALV